MKPNSPLHLANRLEDAAALVEAQANVFALDNEGYPAYHYAKKNPEIRRLSWDTEIKSLLWNKLQAIATSVRSLVRKKHFFSSSWPRRLFPDSSVPQLCE